LITALAVSGVIISAIYGLRSAARVFFGPATGRMNEVTTRHPPVDLNWAEKFPAFILLAALLFIGFWPKSMSDSIQGALDGMKFTPRTITAKTAADNVLQR